MARRGEGYDVVFFVSREDLRGIRSLVGDYVEAASFAARYPELRTAVIRFGDPTTEFAMDDERCVVIQECCGAVDLTRCRLFAYFPASFEPEDVSLRPAQVGDVGGAYDHRQWRVVAEYLETALPRFGACVNEPLRARAGCNKLIQRSALHHAGLAMPATIVGTSRPNLPGPAMRKNLSETGRRDVETPAVLADAEEPASDVVPWIWQDFIAAEAEYRIYVMGEAITTVRIATPERTRVPDMRYRALREVDFALIDDLGAHGARLIAATRALGLRYAVYDALPMGGTLFVTEVNTNGTWFQWPMPIRTVIAERFHAFVHGLAARK